MTTSLQSCPKEPGVFPGKTSLQHFANVCLCTVCTDKIVVFYFYMAQMRRFRLSIHFFVFQTFFPALFVCTMMLAHKYLGRIPLGFFFVS